MKRAFYVVLLLICLSALALGQSVQAYGFVAPSQFRTAGNGAFGFGFGGGIKYITSTGLGVGAEAGAVAPKERLGAFMAAMTSFNGYWAFKLPAEKIEPFITGGYSRTSFNDQGANWGNFGGGVTIWASETLGLLTEFRAHMRKIQADRLGADKILEVRIGAVVR